MAEDNFFILLYIVNDGLLRSVQQIPRQSSPRYNL